MSSAEKVKRDLLVYFKSVAYSGRVYGIQDFNSQVMMNVFDSGERALLRAALDELEAAGVLQQCPGGEFVLTKAGLQMVAGLRGPGGIGRARQAAALSEP